MGVDRVRRRLLFQMSALVGIVAATAGCGTSTADTGTPGLESRGATLTTAKPTRQDLTSKVSLTGKVTLNPIFGLVAPVAGQVRYVDVKPSSSTPTKSTWVASVWANGKANRVDVPAGAVFAGRLAEDNSTVAVGVPIVSAKYVGYGIVADIDGGQAYQLSDTLNAVQAQIKNGPGPFPCTVLGTIAALPPGTIPDPPAKQAPPKGGPDQPGKQATPPGGDQADGSKPDPSEATGLRLVCTPPTDVKLINGVTATVEVVTAKATNVLVVPVEAVAGTQGKGKVDIVKPDKTRETRDVALGLTDGKVIEVKSGLTGDETVAIPGPNLPAAKTENKPGDAPSGP
jgi:hypothetical protein